MDASAGSGGSSGSGGGSGTSTSPAVISCSDVGAIANFENAPDQEFCTTLTSIGQWTSFGGIVTYARETLPSPRGASTKGMHLVTSGAGNVRGTIAAFSSTFDATGFTGVGFWAMGAGQSLGVGMHTTATQADSFKGFILDNTNYAAGLSLTGSWVYYEVAFSDLQPTGATLTLDEKTLREIQFIVTGNSDIWIDDLRFISK